MWGKLAAKGKLSEQQAAESLARVAACSDLQTMSRADLVVEAVVERLDVKCDLFKQLEGIVAPDCILARSEEHTSELQSLMRISYAVFCLKKKKTKTPNKAHN